MASLEIANKSLSVYGFDRLLDGSGFGFRGAGTGGDSGVVSNFGPAS
jgi:hypothetical protein